MLDNGLKQKGFNSGVETIRQTIGLRKIKELLHATSTSNEPPKQTRWVNGIKNARTLRQSCEIIICCRLCRFSTIWDVEPTSAQPTNYLNGPRTTRARWKTKIFFLKQRMVELMSFMKTAMQKHVQNQNMVIHNSWNNWCRFYECQWGMQMVSHSILKNLSDLVEMSTL